jgi:hypothetical protein
MKFVLISLLVLFAFGCPVLGTNTISDQPPASSVTGTDLLFDEQAGAMKRATAAQLEAYLFSGVNASSLTAIGNVPNGANGPAVLDGNSLFSRLGMNSTSVGLAGIGIDIYIAVRTDGVAGTGIATDPFDGSTAAKFTALMEGFAANTRIHLGSGSFYINYGYTIPANTTIEGNGMGVTKIYLNSVNTATNKHDTLFSSNNGITIKNLTLVGNHEVLAASGGLTGSNQYDAESGIEIDGNNTTIKNVEVIDMYGSQNSSPLIESFDIILSGNNNYADNCLTHNYATGAILPGNASAYTNGVDLTGSALGTTGTGNRIFNCHDDGSNHGFTAQTVMGCDTTRNTNVGWYADTGDTSDCTIVGNYFYAAQIPIQFNSNLTANNVNISGNYFYDYNPAGSGPGCIVSTGSPYVAQTAGITSGSPNIALTSLVGIAPGNTISMVTGTGVPTSTTLLSVNLSTMVGIMSANATATNASASVAFTGSRQHWTVKNNHAYNYGGSTGGTLALLFEQSGILYDDIEGNHMDSSMSLGTGWGGSTNHIGANWIGSTYTNPFDDARYDSNGAGTAILSASAPTFTGLNFNVDGQADFLGNANSVQPGVLMVGSPYTGGTSTTDLPLFAISPTGATPATTLSTNGTEIGINAASGFTGNFLDFHLNGGASVFGVNYLGVATVSGLTDTGTTTINTTGSANTTIGGSSGTVSIASPSLTGTPTAPTASSGTNTTQVATTAFTETAANGLLSSNNTWTGTETFNGSAFTLNNQGVTNPGDITSTRNSETVTEQLAGNTTPTFGSACPAVNWILGASSPANFTFIVNPILSGGSDAVLFLTPTGTTNDSGILTTRTPLVLGTFGASKPILFSINNSSLVASNAQFEMSPNGNFLVGTQTDITGTGAIVVKNGVYQTASTYSFSANYNVPLGFSSFTGSTASQTGTLPSPPAAGVPIYHKNESSVSETLSLTSHLIATGATSTSSSITVASGAFVVLWWDGTNWVQQQ